MQEGIDFVECRVCGFRAGVLSRHIGTHGIKANDYANNYPDAKMVADKIQEVRVLKLIERPKKEPRLVCKYCGAKFSGRIQRRAHEKREEESFLNGKDNIDFISCLECGFRSETIMSHLMSQHGMTVVVYREKHKDAKVVLDSLVERRKLSVIAKGGYKLISEKRGAIYCGRCDKWYQPETSVAHLEECVSLHPDNYELNKDYVKCPECGKAMFTRLGEHLGEVHGWSKDRIEIEVGRGLVLMSGKIREKIITSTDFVSASEKREKTNLERYGFANPFSNPVVQEKIVDTNQRRYGVDHPMQNEEIFTRQLDSAQNGPSGQEVFFNEHTCDNVVYIGYGGRFIRTKTGVNKGGRLIKDLNPDFIVLPSNVLESALLASKERRRLDNEKHRSRYVIELLGDWFHSKEVIGVDTETHEKEIVEAYKSVNIECLVLWEKDVMEKWETIRPMVDEWVSKAVKDINERPIWTRATKNKVDHRIATFECPYGSGNKFKTQGKLDRWMVDRLNFWRPDMVEGKDYVKCLECFDVRVGKIAEHLRQSHGGMLKEAYLEKYPNALMVADRIGEQLKENHEVVGLYVKRTAYRCPDGKIVGKRDAWVRAWGVDNPPVDSIVDGSLFDPWKDKVDGIDFVVCSHCGYRAANLSRHLKREHNGIDGYTGPIKSRKCVENLSKGANASWDIRGRKPEKDVSINKTHKNHGLTKEIIDSLYTIDGLSDAKIGERYGLSGEGVGYFRKKYGITTRKKVVADSLAPCVY